MNGLDLTVAISFVFIAYFDYQKTKINRAQVVVTTISMLDRNPITSVYRAMATTLMTSGFSLEEIYDVLYNDPDIFKIVNDINNKE
mgnify:CR=1 FL=1